MKPVRFLSVKEIASILNISVKTVYRKLDHIPGYFNLDGMHFFDEDEFYSGLKRLATKTNKTASQTQQTRIVDKHGLLS